MAKCKTDADCASRGKYANSWNGSPTGKCVNSSMTPGVRVCEVNAWCPTEHDSERNEDNLIRNTLNFTIFIKNEIEFKTYGKKERNIQQNVTNKFISVCAYEEKRGKLETKTVNLRSFQRCISELF